MKLLHEDIISLLTNALSIKNSKADELLAEWVLMIRNEVEKKGEFHAEGLGIFDLKDGKLAFKPDEKLALEINYKYAGMKSIEVLPAYTHSAKETVAPDDKNVDSEEETFIGDKEIVDDHEQIEDSEASESQSALPENEEFGDSADENEADPFAVDIESEQDYAKNSEKKDKSGKNDDTGVVAENEKPAEENIDEEDPFALGDEITDDILFGDEKENIAEEKSDPVNQDDPFDVFEAEEPEPVEPGDESISPVDQDDSFDVLEEEESEPVERVDESKSPVDLDDDIFITEEELFGSSTENEKVEDDSGQGSNQTDEKSSMMAEDVSNAKDQDKTELEKVDPLPESPVGKTTGIGIRPGSKTKQKSGNAPKPKKAESTPESLDLEKVKPSESAGKDSKAGKKKIASSIRGSGSQIWLLPIAAAVILIILFYFHFEDQLMERFQSTSNVDEFIVPPVNEGEPVSSYGEITANDDGAAVEGEESAAQHDEEAGDRTEAERIENNLNQTLGETTETEVSSFGLRGPEVEVNRGSYTIVVHSIVNENRANIEKTTLLEEGFKALMWHAGLPDGRTTWRVGIGQFETVSDAEQALTELPEPYRSNNFIVRIR